MSDESKVIVKLSLTDGQFSALASAEQMRAKCQAIALIKNAEKVASGEYEHGYWDACNEIADAIAALKILESPDV